MDVGGAKVLVCKDSILSILVPCKCVVYCGYPFCIFSDVFLTLCLSSSRSLSPTFPFSFSVPLPLSFHSPTLLPSQVAMRVSLVPRGLALGKVPRHSQSHSSRASMPLPMHGKTDIKPRNHWSGLNFLNIPLKLVEGAFKNYVVV